MMPSMLCATALREVLAAVVQSDAVNCAVVQIERALRTNQNIMFVVGCTAGLHRRGLRICM